MAIVERVILKTEVDSKNAVKGAKRIEGGLKKATKQANLFATAAKFIGAGLLIRGISNLVKSSIGLANSFEQTKISIEQFTGSAEAAAKLLAEIDEFAAKTPFQFDELTDSAKKLLAFNVETEKIVPTLKAIGDISAGTGNRVNELAELYGKAAVQGRIFGEDINQLTGRGIPIIQELAKQFGVTDSEVKKLVATGQVGFANIEQAFIDMTSEGGKFFDLTAKQSLSTAGKISTLQDNVDKLKREFGQKLQPVLNKVIDRLTAFIQAFQETGGIERFIDNMRELFGAVKKVADFMKKAGQFITDPFNLLGGAVEATETLQTALEKLRETRLDRAFEQLGEKTNITATEMEQLRERMKDVNLEGLNQRGIMARLGATYIEFKNAPEQAAEATDVFTESTVKAGKASEITAGTIGDYEKRISDVESALKNKLIPATEEYIAQQKELKGLQEELNDLLLRTLDSLTIEEIATIPVGLTLDPVSSQRTLDDIAAMFAPQTLGEMQDALSDLEGQLLNLAPGTDPFIAKQDEILQKQNEINLALGETVEITSEQVLSAISFTISSASDLLAGFSDVQFERLASQQEAELAAVEGNTEAEQKIREKFSKQREELEKKDATRRQAISVSEALINTAIGVTKALTVLPPLGPILAAIAIATGAAQVALIQSQQFKRGGFTGDGGINDVVGSVHGKEFVFDANTTAKNRRVFEWVHRNKVDLESHMMGLSMKGMEGAIIEGNGHSGSMLGILKKQNLLLQEQNNILKNDHSSSPFDGKKMTYSG